MTINTQKLRDLLTVLKDDECEGEAQYAAAQQIVAAAPALLDLIEAQQAETDRHRRAAGRWKKVAESAEERVRDQAAKIERLRDALEWYAGMSKQMGKAAIRQDSQSILTLMKEIAVDYGKRASAALSQGEPE